MVTDYSPRGAPPSKGLAKDLEQAREILPLEAACPDDGTTIPIKDQDAIEPLPINLDQIAHIHTPDLMREPCLFLRAGMGLLVKRNHLPDRRMAIPVAQ